MCLLARNDIRSLDKNAGFEAVFFVLFGRADCLLSLNEIEFLRTKFDSELVNFSDLWLLNDDDLLRG